MDALTQAVRDHYQEAITNEQDLLDRVGAALDAIEPPLTVEKLSLFDQFHVGGLTATAELSRRVGIAGNEAILDAGSGLGGPSRFLAATFGCQVTGIDLAPAYVAVSTLIAQRMGLSDSVTYRAGSIIDLPFEDQSFDLVWTQHVAMNVVDRDLLHREFRRVLKTGGKLAFYDPFAPDERPGVLYPVPWARTAATSTLLTRAETVASLEAAGLRLADWSDVTQPLAGALAAQQQALSQGESQPAPSQQASLSPALVVGPELGAFVANFGRNLREGRVRLVMGIAEAA